MKLLGIRICEHDSNFAFFDGSTVKYHKIERTKQIKHFAYNSLTDWISDFESIFDTEISTIDEIAIVFDPWNYNIPLVEENFFPYVGFDHFNLPVKVYRLNHHYAHALSTWMLDPVPYDKAIIIDGFGDHDIAWSVFDKNGIVKTGSHKTNGSIGTEMAQAGKFLGITAEHGIDIAGKLMGLQAYGRIDIDFLEHLQQYNIEHVLKIFDVKEWLHFKGQVIGQNSFLDWIATVHKRIEQVLINFFNKFCDVDERIVYAGGVAQNVLWNTALKNKFSNLIIPPHCADDGLSLGALEFLRLKNDLHSFTLDDFPFCQQDVAPVTKVTDETIDIVADLLAQGKTVGWYQDYGEVGPRALGNRSILVNPLLENAKEITNTIKNREEYRPFGASVLNEHKDLYFNGLHDNPFMLFVGECINDSIKSIRHIDNTCRVQTVDKNGTSFRRLLEKFYEKTGCPVLLNTSLNIAGKPLAGNPKDSGEVFKNTKLDCLVIGNDYAVKEI